MQAQAPAPSGLLAIDVLIVPDLSVIDHAREVNAKLRHNYPEGYALDANHLPHVTLTQRYIRSQDLHEVEAAIARVLQQHPISSLQLTVTGYIVSTWGQTGILLYNVERTPKLLALEAAIRDAVQPYAVSGGTAEAFAGSANEQIDPKTIQWVEEFVPAHSGEHYEPHITLGLAHPDFLAKLKAEPFQPIQFKPEALAVYQLGNVGTARQKLLRWSARNY